MIGWWAVADFLVGPVGRWLALLSAFVLAGATGFLKGMEYQQGKQALVEVQTLTKRVEVVKKVAVGEQRISAAYEKGRSERDAEFKKLQAEYEQNIRSVLAALPAVCTWGDDVVGLLNRARDAQRSAPGSSEFIDPMPTTRPALRWETRISAAPDGAGRPTVLGMSGSASAAR